MWSSKTLRGDPKSGQFFSVNWFESESAYVASNMVHPRLTYSSSHPVLALAGLYILLEKAGYNK